MLLLLTFSVLVALGALVYFWNVILDFINESVRPWVAEKMGAKAEQFLVTLTEWLDDGVCLAKRGIKAAWDFFVTRILRMKRTYIVDVTRNSATSIQETIYRDPNNEVFRRIEEKKIAYIDLPDEIRHEMFRQNKRQLALDEREVIKQKAKERAEEQGLQEMVVAML